MKYCLHAFLIAVLAFPIGSYAQPGTVLLQDGMGNPISSHASIQAAYDAIPAPLTQPYVIALASGYLSRQPWESYPIRFTEKAGAGPIHTITIKPDNPATAFFQFKGRSDTSEIFVFDGADWITIDGQRPFVEFPCGFYIRSTTGAQTNPALFPCIRFVNGATHNTLRYFEATNGPRGKGLNNEAHILFDTTSTGTGNSGNIIEYAYFETDNAFRSEGSTLHPNTGNIIRHNFMERIYQHALHIQGGTAATVFDHNEVITETAGQRRITLVRLDYLEDTVRIINNTFRLYNPQRYPIPVDSSLTAVRIAARSANAAGHLCMVANNYITTGAGYYPQGNSLLGPYWDDTSTSLRAISVNTDFPTQATIAFNTVRLMASPAPNATRPLYSAIVEKTGSAPGSNIRILNNIFHNHRQGGTAGSLHTVLHIADTGGLILDYNVYGWAGTLARIGTTGYNSFAAYRTAFPGSDSHSNDSTILFEAIDAAPLSALMMNRPAVTGLPLPYVTTDMAGNVRSLPYRGADEITGTCQSSPFGSAIYTLTDSICPGKPVYLQYAEASWFAPVLPSKGLIHQWQSWGVSGTGYTDIPGAHATELVVPQTENTFYRVKDSCISSGQVYYTNVIGVRMRAAAIVFDSLTALPLSPASFQFTAHHAGPPKYYHWDFGDGQTGFSTLPQITHAYAASGTYTVTVYTDTSCTAPATYQVTATVENTSVGSQGMPGTIKVFPNPVQDLLTIEDLRPIGGYSIADVTGRIVVQGEATETTVRISTGHFPSGVYTLRLSRPQGIQTARFTVMH